MSETTVSIPPPAEPLTVAPKTARFALPQGVVTPIVLRNFLVEKGYATEALKPQQMYGFVKAPGKGENAFPVKFYDEDGNVYDKPSDKVLTRPGVPSLDEGVKWWMARGTKTTKSDTPVQPAAEGHEVEVPAGNPAELAGEFEEAE